MNYIKEFVNFLGVDFFINLGFVLFATFILRFVINFMLNISYCGCDYDLSDNSIETKEYEYISCSMCELAKMGYCDKERQEKFGVCDGYIESEV